MTFKIVALPGDGIGPEIMSGTLDCLDALASQVDFDYTVDSYAMGVLPLINMARPYLMQH